MKIILTIALFIGFLTSAIAQQANSKDDASKKGIASYYHPKFNGRKTATGEIFQNTKYTAASNRIRLNTYVKVTNLNNGKVVYVKINDRMAPSNKRLLDMTEAAAEALDYREEGLAHVKLEIVSEEEGKIAILAQKEAATNARKDNEL